MATGSVARGQGARQASRAAGATAADVAWEAANYQEGCAEARERALTRLATLEARLHAVRPAG